MPLLVRAAELGDCQSIARIYNQGIEERIATFEVAHRTGRDIEKWFDGRHPIIVGEINSKVVGFASTSVYSDRECYNGISEFSVYVDRENRGSGIGRQLMETLIREAENVGFWKLVSRIFVENLQSRALMAKLGFREVGIYEKHAQLDKKWKNVVIVELLLSRDLVQEHETT